MKNLALTAFKLKQLGRWCKVGAWSVLVLGILSAIFNAIFVWHLYTQIQLELQTFNGAQNIQDNPFATSNYSVLPYFAEICQDSVLPIAIFIILFIAGTIFTAQATAIEPTAQETEDIVYEPLKTPIKMHQ